VSEANTKSDWHVGPLPTTLNFKLQTSNFKLQTSNFKLQIKSILLEYIINIKNLYTRFWHQALAPFPDALELKTLNFKKIKKKAVGHLI